MIVHTEPDNNSAPPSIKLYSDAPTEEEAMREIKGWAILNRSAQLREPHLMTTVLDGMKVYIGTAYHVDTIGNYGQRIYDAIGEALETADLGKIVAINVLSQDYFVANHEHEASEGLRAKHPDAVPYLVKIGYNAVASMGGTITRTRRS